MTNFWIVYALKVILFHGICYAVYWTFLRQLHHFVLNRLYLLCTLLLGCVAPLVMLPGAVLSTSPMNEVTIIAGTFIEVQEHTGVPSAVDAGQSILLLYFLYLAGSSVLFVRSICSVIIISRIRKAGIEDPTCRPKVVRINQPMAFSFLNTIFLDHSANPTVLLHEEGHVRGRHWVDLMLLEMLCIAYWINPFVWLYRKSLKQQHEYLADAYVLHQGVTQEGYLTCILDSLSLEEPIGPVHKFNSKSLKQRISMMTKNQFSPYSKVTYLVLVPLVVFLLFSFAERKPGLSAVDQAKVFVIDAAHGGPDAGAMSEAGISEKEISLAVAKLVQQIGKEKGLDIQLTRTTDEKLSLQERVIISSKAKADVFLSLHVGFDENGVAKGIEMHVSEENVKYSESKKIATLLSTELAQVKALRTPVVKNSKAFVLKSNTAASAIVEMGYLSDVGDANFITQPANQKLVAEQIVNALVKY